MKAKPPVFIISGKSPLGDPGGYPAYAFSLSKLIKAAGHEASILALDTREHIEKMEGTEVIFVNMGPLKHFPVLKHLALAGLPYYAFVFANAMRKIIKERGLSKFILWGMGPWTFPGVFLKFFPVKGARVVLLSSYFTSTRHEMEGALRSIRIKDYGLIPKIRYWLVYEIVARIFEVFEKLSLDFSDLVVVHYNSSKKIIKEHFGTEGKKVIMFPWYTEVFKREGEKGKLTKNKYRHPLVVSICRQDPRKGINFIIHAIKLVAREIPDVNCLIVGSGSFYNLNKQLVEKLGVEKNVQMTGFVSDIKPILREADIAVIVPLRQGSSALTVFEAMNYGKAIVGSTTDGIPEDLINEESALLVPSANEYALAEAIKRLIQDAKLRKTLSENAYKRFKSRFGFEKTTEDTKKLLDSISVA